MWRILISFRGREYHRGKRDGRRSFRCRLRVEEVTETTKSSLERKSPPREMRAQLHATDKSVTSRCNLEIFLRQFHSARKREARNGIATSAGQFVREFPRRSCLYSTFHCGELPVKFSPFDERNVKLCCKKPGPLGSRCGEALDIFCRPTLRPRNRNALSTGIILSSPARKPKRTQCHGDDPSLQR